MSDSRTGIRIQVAIVAALVMMMPALASTENWDQAATAKFELFLPGHASWEWLLIPTDHTSSPARRIREGRPCLSCHEGEAAAIGNAVASGQRLEPDPLPGLPGTVALTVQGLVSNGNLHLRLSWPAVELDQPAGAGEHAAMVTTLVADDAISTARAATCWASCHSDLSGMGDDAGKDLTKYLPNSRERMTRTGGGDALKSSDELAAELDKGAFLEYWTASLAKDGGVSAKDGYFLEARVANNDSAVEARAERDGNRWVVTIQRPLAPETGPRKHLAVGQTYPISFAIHESHTEGRRHYVSFPLAVTIGKDSIEIVEVLE